jgi:hypothetical protein
MIKHALREQMLGGSLRRSGGRRRGRGRKRKKGSVERGGRNGIPRRRRGENEIKIEGRKLGNLGKRLSTDKEVLTVNRKMKVLRSHHRMIVLKDLLRTFGAEEPMKCRKSDGDKSKRKEGEGAGAEKNAGKNSRKTRGSKETWIEVAGGQPGAKLFESRREKRVLRLGSIRSGEQDKTGKLKPSRESNPLVLRLGHLSANKGHRIRVSHSSNSTNIRDSRIVNRLGDKTVRNGDREMIGTRKKNRIGGIKGTNGLRNRDGKTMDGKKMMWTSGFKKSNRKNKLFGNDARTAKPRRSIPGLDIGPVSMAFETINKFFLLKGKRVKFRQERMVEQVGLRRDNESGVESVEVWRLGKKRGNLGLRVKHEGIIHVSKRGGDIEGGGIQISSTVTSCYHLIKRGGEGWDAMGELTNFGRFHEKRGGGKRQKGGQNMIVGVKLKRFVGRVRMAERAITRKSETFWRKEIVERVGKMVGIVGERLLKDRNGGVDEGGKKNRLGVGAGGGIKHMIKGGHDWAEVNHRTGKP